ncbi:MAG: ParB/RepB/Spo0J family partition protein [Pirellulales bacterium]|nr:ParB/RepB/Spo0J family partition protein [Pirellulales bacterium]
MLALLAPIERIGPSPYNPRRDFPAEEIEQLAATIRAVGIVQPIVVRRMVSGRYEVVAGERRLRAAKAAGLDKVPVIIRDLDDDQAREMAIMENLARKDLNAIEEAQGFAALLKGPSAPTQTELAARLGCSQGHVANRLRLLRLPKAWRDRIRSGTLPPSHARAIVPYCEHPTLMAAIGRELDADLKRNDGRLSDVETFQAGIEYAINMSTKPLEGQRYDCRRGGHVPVFAPTPDEEAQLGVIEIDLDGQKERRATNTKLWEKLQNKHATKWLKENAKGRNGRAAKKAAGKNGKPKPPSPEEEAARAREQARQFARRLWEFYVDWLRYLCAQVLADATPAEDLIPVLLWFAQGHVPFGMHRSTSDVAAVLKTRKLPGSGGAAILAIPAKKATEIGGAIAGRWFHDPKEGPRPFVPDPIVRAVAERLGIDPEAEWRRERAGPLTERYFNLHGKERLLALADELGTDLADAERATKAACVAAMMKRTGLALPKELARPRRPK